MKSTIRYIFFTYVYTILHLFVSSCFSLIFVSIMVLSNHFLYFKWHLFKHKYKKLEEDLFHLLVVFFHQIGLQCFYHNYFYYHLFLSLNNINDKLIEVFFLQCEVPPLKWIQFLHQKSFLPKFSSYQ